MMRAPDTKRAEQVNRALAVLELPLEDEKCRQLVLFVIRSLERELDEFDELSAALDSKRSRASLERYLKALRRAHACRVALDPSIPAEFFRVDVVSDELDFLETILKKPKRPRRPSGRPVDEVTRNAVAAARLLLEMHRLEPTTDRKGKWHRLAQIFADTERDLRHHLDNLLEEQPPAAE
jgi:hypothetical protein